MTKLTPAFLLFAFASPAAALAQTCNSGNSFSGGSATIPVVVGNGTLSLSDSGKSVSDYSARMGANDQYTLICVIGDTETTLVFDLGNSNRDLVFEDIRYTFPPGFAPSDSPFKLTTINKRNINMHFKGSAATSGRTFKYDLILRNTSTGERLVIDPTVINKPK